MRVHILCVQLNPELGKVAANINAANSLVYTWLIKAIPLSKMPRFLVLPELAFTGYKFNNRKHIEPFLEIAGKGPTFKWAQEVSKKLECHTLVGYPEIVPDTKTIYNSAVLVGPNGDLLFNYRKTFLYETDEEWGCSESDDRSFPYVDIDVDVGEHEHGGGAHGGAHGGVKLRVQIGICMDLNPYKFEASFENFEFSTKAYEHDADIALCPMAWLSSASPSIKDPTRIITEFHRKALETPTRPDGSTLNYWALRNFPFIDHARQKPYGFVTCNRSGWDGNVHYAGTSSILKFEVEGSEKPVTAYGTLNQDEVGILEGELELQGRR